MARERLANPAETFTYDEDGNMTRGPGVSPGNPLSYTWDAENRLIGVAPASTPVNGDKKLDFTYDYRGRRVKKVVSTHNGTAWTQTLDRRFVYDGWNVLLELNGDDDSTVRTYTWGLDLSGTFQAAGGIGGLLAMHAPGSPDKNYLYFYDANGNIGQLVDIDNSGTIVAHYEYDPYGGVMSSSGAYKDDNPYRFASQYFDSSSGLYSHGYRYYFPRTGRFLNRDRIQEDGGFGLYVFAGNGPTVLIDVLGLQDYKVGDTPPPHPNHDGGAGVWGSETDTLADWRALRNWRNIADAARLMNMPDAARHMDHFLDNTGAELTIDARGMVKSSSRAKKHFYDELNAAMAFAEGVGGKRFFNIISTQYTGGDIEPDNWNWFFAVNGYSSYGEGSVRRIGNGCSFQMVFVYHVDDQYNWDVGKSVRIFGMKVPDTSLGRLHLVGLAEEYHMVGSVEKIVRWKRGMRFDPKTGKPKAGPTNPRQPR